MSGSTTSKEHRLAHVELDAAWTLPRDAARTPLFTRHMLGVIELERDERRRRRAAIRGGDTRYEPVQGVVEPRIAAVSAAEARAPALAALDLDRWVDEGGSFDAARYADDGDEAMQLVMDQDKRRPIPLAPRRRRRSQARDLGGGLLPAKEARTAAADVHEHAQAAAGTVG